MPSSPRASEYVASTDIKTLIWIPSNEFVIRSHSTRSRLITWQKIVDQEREWYSRTDAQPINDDFVPCRCTIHVTQPKNNEYNTVDS